MTPAEIKKMAKAITHDIFEMGSGPTPCQRIAFKGGDYPNAEIDQGGLCEESLLRLIVKTIKEFPK